MSSLRSIAVRIQESPFCIPDAGSVEAHGYRCARWKVLEIEQRSRPAVAGQFGSSQNAPAAKERLEAVHAQAGSFREGFGKTENCFARDSDTRFARSR